ncbi:MAG: hypothetical protein IKY01_01560 [Prevotella sp.]|nr:hypothetical protein [Prevotella sp.]
MTVESPGILPGLVRPYNIREMHFSRNPKIAMYMRSYKLVKEFGEGVDRMFREMEAAGCPAPEYRQNEFMVYATLRQHKDAGTEQADQTNGQLNGGLNGGLNESQKTTLEFIRLHEGYNTKQISTGLDVPFDTIDKHIRILLKQGHIEHRGSKKTGGYYVVKNE